MAAVNCCPKCGNYTFYQTPRGRKCNRCGYEMIVPPNGGMPGKGTKCHNCGRNAVFNGKCTKCGSIYK